MPLYARAGTGTGCEHRDSAIARGTPTNGCVQLYLSIDKSLLVIPKFQSAVGESNRGVPCTAVSSRLLFSHEVSRDYAERRVQILCNRKYHGRKGLILLMFHLIHNVICYALNVKIVK